MNARVASFFIRLITTLVLLCSLLLTNFSPVAAAQRCYVKAGAAGNGTSWAAAYGTLQEALANAACTEIWVAKGTYKPTAGTDRTISFVLKSGVAIYGGFAGTETLLTQRNLAVNPTILSGEIGSAAAADNSYHVVLGSGTDNTARLDGFTVTAGYANSGFPNSAGAGMYNGSGGSPTLANLTFIGNTANGGGGMFNVGAGTSPILINVTFSGNAASNGAGMTNELNSSPSLTNVTFSGNTATALGGGMANSQSNPILMNTTFAGNGASVGGGGAIYNYSGDISITNSIFFGNVNGEIIISSGTATVAYSIVQGGYAGTGNLDANPRLLPLGNYGGPTRTMALGYGSPAIDHGTNAGCPLTDQRGVSRPRDGDGNTTVICDMGATESQGLASRTFLSVATQDGWVLESTEASGLGGSTFPTDATLIVGDSTLKQQARGILSFNTAALPDYAVVRSATLKVKQAAISTLNPFNVLGNLLVDVRKGPFSNNAALQAADFAATASKLAVMTILNNPAAGGWYSRAMPATGLGYINKAGLTQFRMRFSLDDNNDAVSNYIKFYSGNAPAASRPVLSLKYYLP